MHFKISPYIYAGQFYNTPVPDDVAASIAELRRKFEVRTHTGVVDCNILELCAHYIIVSHGVYDIALCKQLPFQNQNVKGKIKSKSVYWILSTLCHNIVQIKASSCV